MASEAAFPENDEVPVEDALEQAQDAEPEDDPAEDYPPDAVGFDGSPVEEILADRKERLDPDNRPENSEVSNAGREFDSEKGMFTDQPGYEDAPKIYDDDET
ncbi:hypothetical protein [Nocardioides silvaticus]|nr:hypothetical protein [Nocardioides silvaticus]